MNKKNILKTKTQSKTNTNSRNCQKTVDGSLPVLATVVSPNGKNYPVTNITAFARRFRLDSSALGKVLRGDRQTHKNWRLAD